MVLNTMSTTNALSAGLSTHPCLQGIVGTMPWVALGFTTLYLQLLGFTNLNTAILVATFSLGCAIGSLGGGAIGER